MDEVNVTSGAVFVVDVFRGVAVHEDAH